MARRGSGQRNSAKTYYMRLQTGALSFFDSERSRNTAKSRRPILLRGATPYTRTPCCPLPAYTAHCASAKLAGLLTCEHVSIGTDVRTIRWSAATISTPIETFQLFATKKKEVGADHLDKTHAMFHAMHNFMSVHRELPSSR